MSKNLNSTIRAELGWTWRDESGETAIVDSNRLRKLIDLADGTGSDQADTVWHAQEQSLATGASTTLSLDDLAQSIFGDSISLSFSKIKALLIANTSTTAGYLLVGGAASDQWYEPFAASGDKIKVMPGGQLLLTHPGTGWSVAAGSTDLKIAAVGATVSYDIAILGTGS